MKPTKSGHDSAIPGHNHGQTALLIRAISADSYNRTTLVHESDNHLIYNKLCKYTKLLTSNDLLNICATKPNRTIG